MKITAYIRVVWATTYGEHDHQQVEAVPAWWEIYVEAGFTFFKSPRYTGVDISLASVRWRLGHMNNYGTKR